MKTAQDQKKNEIWGKRLFYFHCPVCEKPYSIEFDMNLSPETEPGFDDNTTALTKGDCLFCETKLLIAYDTDQQQVVAYDLVEEKHWQEQSILFEKVWKKLQKLKKAKKTKLTEKQKEKKKALQKSCKKLEKKITLHDNEYSQNCLIQALARKTQESIPFPMKQTEEPVSK